MDIKRDYQAEYDLLIASADGDARTAQSTSEQITELRNTAGYNLERDYQGEYDLLITASARAVENSDSDLSIYLTAAIGVLIQAAKVAGEQIAAHAVAN
jgi:hypothetical protein